MYAVAMGTSEWEAFVPRSHSLTSFRGRRVFSAFIDTASPLLPILVVPLFLIAPPFYTIGGAIFFRLLTITIYPPRACLPRLGFTDRFGRLRRRDVRARRSHLPVRAPCGFLEVSYGTACPVLACPSRRASFALPLPRHAYRDVIVPIASLIVSSCVLIAPRPVPRHAGRGEAIACSCGAFHVRTP